jgi:hypothetical protein
VWIVLNLDGHMLSLANISVTSDVKEREPIFGDGL